MISQYELDSEIVDDIPDDDIPVEELLDKVVSAVPASAFVKTDSKPKQQILLQAQQILKPGNVQSMLIRIYSYIYFEENL